MSCEERFLAALHQRGLRMTPQREAILRVLHGFQDPVSAEEIHRRAASLNQGLEISTVYRTLDLLQSLGLVSCLETSDRGRRYMHTVEEEAHFHLVCRKCGAVIGVAAAAMEELVEQIELEYGFQLDVGRTNLAGCCRRCR